MTNANDGGPAFPFKDEDGQGGFHQNPGMTLRDWFAGQAVNGILLDPQHGDQAQGNPGQAAIWAYSVADAMLAARGGAK